jgi:hypothetical protein
MIYKAIVSGHTWKEDGFWYCEILSEVNNDKKGTEIFCDLNHELALSIDSKEDEDYYFMALVEAEFAEIQTQEGTDYTVEYNVKEIKSIEDIPCSL